MAGNKLVLERDLGSQYEYGISTTPSPSAVVGPQSSNEFNDYNGNEFVDGQIYYLWWRLIGFSWDKQQADPIQYINPTQNPVTWHDTLKVDPIAKIAPTMQVGATIIGKGKDDKGRDIRFLQDLEEAPETGEFVVSVTDKQSKASFWMSITRLFNIGNGDEITTPSEDPGPPVAPAYADITISSGEQLNTVLPAFTKTDGTAYPAGLLSYQLGTQLQGFTFSSGSRLFSGSRVTSTEVVTTVQVIASVITGPRQGTQVTGSFKLTILAAPVTALPQPTVIVGISNAPVSAITITQGQTNSLQATVSYPNGLSKGGVFSATGLPTGLTINPVTGTFPNAPTTPGVYPVTVTFTDTDNQTGSYNLIITVAAAPVTTWLGGMFINTDVNTRTAELLLQVASGTTSVLVAFKAVDNTIYVGKGNNGVSVTTDSSGAGYFQTADAIIGGGEFNEKAVFYPTSFSPITNGLALGKAYQVFVKRPGDSSPQTGYFFFDPTTNQNAAALLSSPPSGGAGSNVLKTPVVAPQTVSAGKPFEVRFKRFWGALTGETITYTYPGLPTGITITQDNTADEFVVSGTYSVIGSFTVSIVGTGSLGSYGALNVPFTAIQEATVIDRLGIAFDYQDPGSAGGTNGLAFLYAQVNDNSELEGALFYANLPDLGSSPIALMDKGSWTLADGTTYNRRTSTGQRIIVNPSANLKLQVRKFPASTTVKLYTTYQLSQVDVSKQVVVTIQQGNNLTPNRLLRLGQPNATTTPFALTTSWIDGPDGLKWMQVAATLPSSTYGWKVFVNGEAVSGFPIKLPQHTQATIDIMDCNQYLPNVAGNPVAAKAQAIIYTGEYGGSNVTQNT